MAELQRTVNTGINVSAPITVLSYTYNGTDPLEVVARVDLGSVTNPIAGGGAYTLSVYINNTLVSPDSSVTVGAVTKTILMSRPLAIESGDVITLSATGRVSDTVVDVVASLRDVTPIAITDLEGTGSVVVDHNYGGTDALRYVYHGAGVAGASINVYLKTDWDTGNRSSTFVVASSLTDVNGRWVRAVMLNPATYTLVLFKTGAFGPDFVDVTVS